jgi:ABC-type hemin transport system ATPase subunit
MAFAAEVCDRVVILKEGRIMADGALSLLNDNGLLQNFGL